MHFDDTEELQEPKFCCYRKRWLASRALIWSFVSVGATLFSIGYVLTVFTAHYPDDPFTANVFRISGVTLVIAGGILTLLGIVACFHSCCIVLCYRPAQKSDRQKGGSQKSTNSERSEKSAITSSLPINSHQQVVRNVDSQSHPDLLVKQQQQQQPFLVNGGFYPVTNSRATPPPPPQRSATSPKFFPIQDDNVVPTPWNPLQDGDKRKHQSQGNVRQTSNDWSDSERSRFLPLTDKSPESGKDAHPYNDDFLLQQHMRKKMTSEIMGDSGSRTASTKSSSGAPFQGYPANQVRKAAVEPGKIRAKPMFRIGGGQPSEIRREADGHDSVWEHSTASQQQQDSTTSNKSPLMPTRSTNSVRHRQYFHEEHFTFSDFEPDDAFIQLNEQQILIQRNEPNMLASNNRATSSKSPLLSGGVANSRVDNRKHSQQTQQMKHVYANNSNIVNSPKLPLIIPASTTSTNSVNNNVPVNSSSLTTTYLQHHHQQQMAQQQQQHFSVDIIDSNTPLPHQAPLSGGSTSSGRGSGSRGGGDHQDGTIPLTFPSSTTVMATQQGSSVPPSSGSLPPSSAVVTVTMASPCLIRRVSPATQRRQSPSVVGRTREQTPDFIGPGQSFPLQSGPDMEMRDFVKTPNGRIKCSPIRSVPHQPEPESIAFNAAFRTTVIRGQLPNQRQFSDEVGADYDNTSPDPEDAFPTPKKSPKRDRMTKISETTRQSLPSAPPPMFVNVNERALMTSRKTSPGVVSSAFISHRPAQDPYPTTQAFLCEQEEMI